MKLLTNIAMYICILIQFLHADTQAFMIENDAIAEQDAHYTNGIFYTWLSDEESSLGKDFISNLKTNNAISFNHLIFTPKDKLQKQPILNDIPYAGYAKLNFLLYKSSKYFLHEFGINIGMVGSSVRAKELQTAFHTMIGATKAKGWDNQLKDKFMPGFSYNFIQKTPKLAFGRLQMDTTYNAKGDLGRFYSGISTSINLRVGNKLDGNFANTTTFIGGNESDLLNFEKMKSYNWNVTFGLFANKIYNYYLIQEARNLGYNLSKINYILGGQLTFNMFYRDINYAFKLKSISIKTTDKNNQKKTWAGVGVIWKF